MNFEQENKNSRVESLKVEFRKALEKYAYTADSNSNMEYVADKETNCENESRARAEIREREKEIICIIARELRSSNNPREILNVMAKVFRDVNVSRSSLYENDNVTDESVQLSFLQDVIVEVLTKK